MSIIDGFFDFIDDLQWDISGRRHGPCQPVIKVRVFVLQKLLILRNFDGGKIDDIFVCKTAEDEIHLPRSTVPRPVNQPFAEVFDIFYTAGFIRHTGDTIAP